MKNLSILFLYVVLNVPLMGFDPGWGFDNSKKDGIDYKNTLAYQDDVFKYYVENAFILDQSLSYSRILSVTERIKPSYYGIATLSFTIKSKTKESCSQLLEKLDAHQQRIFYLIPGFCTKNAPPERI